MKGAIRLSAEHLKDASFLINCDSENYDELTVGSAGSVDLDFTRELKRVEPETPSPGRSRSRACSAAIPASASATAAAMPSARSR